MDKDRAVAMHKLLDRMVSSSNSVKQLFKWTTEADGTITHLINSNVDNDVCDKLSEYYNKKLDIIDKFIKEIQ